MVLPDWQIRNRIGITPFAEGETRLGVISYGLSHYGYDLRVGNHFRVSGNMFGNGFSDPKAFDPGNLHEVETNVLEIPPHGYALAETVEYVKMPRDCIGMVVDKSTYRRCGILMGATIIEPEWEGKITLEITNATPLWARIYANEGIAQIIFIRGNGVCAVSYADKRGRYQGQTGLTLPFVEGGVIP